MHTGVTAKKARDAQHILLVFIQLFPLHALFYVLQCVQELLCDIYCSVPGIRHGLDLALAD